MFNDKYGLTQAVLEGRKTMTRRIVALESTLAITWDCVTEIDRDIAIKNYIVGNIKNRYEVGEVVAIAQCYQDIDNYYYAALRRKTSIHGQIIDELDLVDIHDIIKWKSLRDDLMNTPGWTNKMFVKADLMPHHIKITGIKVERLQDISDEDCLEEGVVQKFDADGTPRYYVSWCKHTWAYATDSAKDAYHFLIDKVSGKGTWESNPYVWVYEFELVD